MQSVKKTQNNTVRGDLEKLNERFCHQSCDSAIVAELEIPPGEQPSRTMDCQVDSLPLHLRALKDMFMALLSVYGMMRSRNMQTSLKSMKEGVESVSKRRFGEKELYQLKTLVPDLLHLEEIGENILIKLSDTKNTTNAISWFNKALLHFISDKKGMKTTEVPAWGCLKSISTAEKRPVFQSPKKKRQRRLSILCSAKEIKSSDGSILGHMGNEDLLGSLPGELRRRSLDGIISIDSLHKLEENEKEHRRLSGSEAQLERHKRATISSLPDIFQRIQAIVGKRGPKVLGLEILCNRIRSGGLETVSKSDIIARIRCLAEHVPEFLVVESTGRSGEEDVWIKRDKAVDYSDIMTRLIALQKSI